MKFAAILAVGAALLVGNSAMAQTACSRPAAPSVPDGKTATMEQLLAAKSTVAAFVTASDTYQSCVLDDLSSQQAAAKAIKSSVDPAVEKAAKTKVSDNQAEKEKAGKSFNDAVKAFKAAHPS